MKSNDKGVVRNIDKLGRLVIPKEVRKMLGLSVDEPVEMTVVGSTVVVRKYLPACIICGNTKDVFETKNEKKICYECLEYMKK